MIRKSSMTFVFDENKMALDNISIDYLLGPIRNYFFKHNIKEIKTGIFEGTDSDYEYFSTCVWELPDKEIFRKYIKEWYWLVDGHIENCKEELKI